MYYIVKTARRSLPGTKHPYSTTGFGLFLFHFCFFFWFYAGGFRGRDARSLKEIPVGSRIFITIRFIYDTILVITINETCRYINYCHMNQKRHAELEFKIQTLIFKLVQNYMGDWWYICFWRDFFQFASQ